MNDMTFRAVLPRLSMADAMRGYFAEGIGRAQTLGDRGSIRMGPDGKLYNLRDVYILIGQD